MLKTAIQGPGTSPVLQPLPKEEPIRAENRVPEELKLSGSLDYGSWVDLNTWARELGLPRPTLLLVGTNYVASIKFPTGTLELRPGRHQARWEDGELWLGHPPIFVRGRCCLHGQDIAKTLWPVLTDDGRQILTNDVIMIDPGHGGSNPGARNAATGRWEKEYTLDWAQRLKAILEKHGWKVYLTRTNDVDPGLEGRVRITDAVGAALFLSLHFNDSDGRPSESGIETYCLTPTGLPSAIRRGGPEETSVSFPNNLYDTENVRLAFRLQRTLVKRTGAVDRGVRRARFMAVLRNQSRPAILIEGGYLSNPREARLIATPSYREALAIAIAEALGTPGPPSLVLE
ncbi:MAG: N-acetylmuramoyl-L-alanine amidase [Verrucomicrobiae bacterium]|nr:N-acetylmuramoyl-L-alanine amidase [Verrucomicrobiae bacterium]